MQDGAGSGKQVVELPIDVDLLERAKRQSLDLAALLESALERQLGKTTESDNAGAAQWRRDNAATIAAWNAEVEREGLWNDDFRLF